MPACWQRKGGLGGAPFSLALDFSTSGLPLSTCRLCRHSDSGANPTTSPDFPCPSLRNDLGPASVDRLRLVPGFAPLSPFGGGGLRPHRPGRPRRAPLARRDRTGGPRLMLRRGLRTSRWTRSAPGRGSPVRQQSGDLHGAVDGREDWRRDFGRLENVSVHDGSASFPIVVLRAYRPKNDSMPSVFLFRRPGSSSGFSRQGFRSIQRRVTTALVQPNI